MVIIHLLFLEFFRFPAAKSGASSLSSSCCCCSLVIIISLCQWCCFLRTSIQICFSSSRILGGRLTWELVALSLCYCRVTECNAEGIQHRGEENFHTFLKPNHGRNPPPKKHLFFFSSHLCKGLGLSKPPGL